MKEASAPAERHALPASLLLCYGLPGLPLAALTLPLFVYLPPFYAEELGLGLAAVGGLLLVARLWDLLTDPLIGWASDRFRTRWGRRKPWLLAGLPLMLPSAWLLFAPPEGAGAAHLLVWTLLLYLAGTMIQLPYQAWGAEISDAYAGRSRVSAAREVFVVAGVLLAAGLPGLFGSDRETALLSLAWLITLTLPPAILLALWRVPEPAPGSVAPAMPGGFKRGLGLLRRNGPFRRLIAAYFLNGIANGLPASLFLLYVGAVLDAEAWAGGLLFVYFACGILAVPLWLRLSDRWGKHRAWNLAMVIACAIFATVPLLGPGDVVWFLAICIGTGLCLGADLVLPASMQADVIDVDRLLSRRQGREQSRAGLYFGLWGMATKLALALAVGLAYPLLDLAGFREGAGSDQDGLALFSLAALYSLAPAAIKIAAVLLMRRYPITPARHARLQRRLEAA